MPSTALGTEDVQDPRLSHLVFAVASTKQGLT